MIEISNQKPEIDRTDKITTVQHNPTIYTVFKILTRSRHKQIERKRMKKNIMYMVPQEEVWWLC